MKIERLFIYCLLAGTSLLASCSSEDMADNQVETLPEGMYPLTFTATQGEVMATPQTRVSENTDGASSKWDGGEVINVAIGKGGLGDATNITCTLKADGSVNTCSKQLYWQNTQSSTVNAWYSNITGQGTMTSNTVSLSDQSSGLAYVLKTDEISPKYNTDNGKIALNFNHKLAKVRVKVIKGSYTGALNVTAVSVKGYTSCTVSNGSVSPIGNLNSIQMKQNGSYWEANLVPGTGALGNVITINADGKSTTCTLASAVDLTAAQIYTYEVTVDAPATVVNISNISGTEYTVSGNIHLKGDENIKNLKIIMEAGSKLTLENVNLNPQSVGSAITCKGDATISIKGTNALVCYKGADVTNSYGILVENGTLVINGENDAQLTVTGQSKYSTGAGIGASNKANITINGSHIIANKDGIGNSAGIGSAGQGKTCGIITITGGIIESWAGNYSAGIGGSNSGACGDIIIKGGKIKAYGGLQSPGIGNGDDASCGDISISGANTEVYAKKGSENGRSPESIGWNNYNGSCGKVTIGSECNVTQE